MYKYTYIVYRDKHTYSNTHIIKYIDILKILFKVPCIFYFVQKLVYVYIYIHIMKNYCLEKYLKKTHIHFIIKRIIMNTLFPASPGSPEKPGAPLKPFKPWGPGLPCRPGLPRHPETPNSPLEPLNPFLPGGPSISARSSGGWVGFPPTGLN